MKETNEAIQEVLNLSEELTHHKHGKCLIILYRNSVMFNTMHCTVSMYCDFKI